MVLVMVEVLVGVVLDMVTVLSLCVRRRTCEVDPSADEVGAVAKLIITLWTNVTLCLGSATSTLAGCGRLRIQAAGFGLGRFPI